MRNFGGKIHDSMNRTVKAIVLCALPCLSLDAATPGGVDYAAEFVGATSTGSFAPYMLASGRNGLLSRKNTALLDIAAEKRLDTERRFSWAAGVELAAGYTSASRYELYDSEAASWGSRTQRPAAFHVQQLYATVKYRRVFLTAGQKSPKSYISDDRISAGDFTRSANARGIPGFEAGFVDFVDVPFTRGWLQIDGVIGYGKFTDNSFRRGQYNYYNDVLATGNYYTYKRCHLRTDPRRPFSVTAGIQGAGQFGGRTAWYEKGLLVREEDRGFRLKDAWDMMLPIQNGGEGFFTGNSLGSIDIKLRYRLRSGAELSAYLQNPWEDGTSMAKLNGWDGIWGIAYHREGRHLISDACLEYLDFTNESGPVHWAPGDYPGTTITWPATGGDNYFNNDMYGAYANYGMSIGTPFLVAPVYNLDGTPMFAHNMARGFHAGAAGAIGPDVDWRAALSYQKAWGQGRTPQAHPLHDTSAMFEAVWHADRLLPGLRLTAQMAFDCGNLRGDSFGALVGVRYSGNLSLK